MNQQIPPDPGRIDAAYWIVLARPSRSDETHAFGRAWAAEGLAGAVRHLIASPEFRLLLFGWRDDIGIGKDPIAHEAGLRALGDAAAFVDDLYDFLLGREADPAGRAHHIALLDAGESRRQLVRQLVLSEEFAARYSRLEGHQEGGYLPRDVQLCELANPAKWDNPDWLRLLHALHRPPHKLAMHRKSYEFAQLLFGLDRLGAIRPHATVLSVGAGHECTLYWLANHVGHVVATDTYDGRWQSEGDHEGDEAVLVAPEDYAPFPYRRDRLTLRRMDGRQLAFADGHFDVVYSLSSIEHFGGFAGAREALVEMGRTLKPGGVLAVATEYIVSGPDYEEAFQPEAVHRLAALPGLQLVEPIDEHVYRRYDTRPVDLRQDVNQRPHMLVKIDDTVFTSVMMFFRKDTSVPQQ